MLYTQKLLAELERKREQLMGYQSRDGAQLAAYRAALAARGSRFASAAAITAAQRALEADSSGNAQSAGARATDEYDRWRRLSASGVPVLPFGQTFAHHQQARAWAECLRGTTTFAVDGSQLPPWRDASVPIALVQVGLFENPHQPPRPYVKDVTTVLLTPDELTATDSDTVDMRTGETLGYSQLIVSLRRFELEVETLVARMEHHAAARGEASPVSAPVLALYDGSLIVSFALKMAPPYRDRYVAAARRLLEASERCRTPLIGYIDTSYARDIVTMVTRLA
ncbi:MAG: DNA double-strand break repair nuclease NurA, partial [Ktedonobacterales bacterium]